MLRQTDKLLTMARHCANDKGHQDVADAGKSVMSYIVLHLNHTVIEIPRELVPFVRIIEKFCEVDT